MSPATSKHLTSPGQCPARSDRWAEVTTCGRAVTSAARDSLLRSDEPQRDCKLASKDRGRQARAAAPHAAGGLCPIGSVANACDAIRQLSAPLRPPQLVGAIGFPVVALDGRPTRELNRPYNFQVPSSSHPHAPRNRSAAHGNGPSRVRVGGRSLAAGHLPESACCRPWQHALASPGGGQKLGRRPPA